MGLKQKLKIILKNVTGLSVYKNIPFGIDPMHDIKQRMTGHKFTTFLDVGANIGQTAKQIRLAFPHAIIHSVEPVKNTFQLLQQNTKSDNIITHNVALGSKNEIIEIKIDGSNTNNSINSMLNDNNELVSGNIITEKIQVVSTLDFCKSLNIGYIDYLKIDTEGYDLEVIKGAEALLAEHAISFIEAEVSMNPGNTFHVSLEEVKNYMEQHNYFLFGLYEQVLEWKTAAPVLRRSNALFISSHLVKEYTN